VVATFAADSAGSWLIQVLATAASGPRPVAEAIVNVDTDPPVRFQGTPAPGEAAGAGTTDDRDALGRMIDAARATERLAPLRRDARLDAVAQAHADAMLAARRVGHDVGDGDPASRVEAAGVVARVAGENVAHAATLPRAHRSLWSSPSHRGNLLFDGFDAVGIGLARDQDGSVWVCEVFADLR
jgi:uncharacterized protein YkwD